jgi:hypothetical protein
VGNTLMGMTKEAAQAACLRFAAEHADRHTHHWVPRESPDGGWEVAKIALPAPRTPPMTTEARAEPKPPHGDDPRPSTFRDIPPFGAIGG